MSNVPNSKLKFGKILGCLKFVSADSPRVRGGRSAVHKTCLPEALQKCFKPQNYTADGPPKDRGRSADHRFNLQASDTPMGCLLSKSRTVRQRSADGPQLVRKIEQRQFQSGVDQISPEADGPPMKRGRSALGQIVGVGQT